MSTVASGAATMKMISSTSITSMNGVTLISWFSTRSSFSALELRLPAMVLLRCAGRPLMSRDGTVVEVAADETLHCSRCVAEQELVAGDRARERVVDHDGR